MIRNIRQRRVAGLAFALSFAGGLCISCSSSTTGQPSAANVERRTQPLEWGLYQIFESRRYGEIIEKELTRFASRPQYVMFYRDLARPYPKRAVDAVDKCGATTVVSLELWTWHGGRQRGSILPAINRGEYDEFFRKWAADAKRDGRRVLLRFGFEFNGDWFGWSGDPSAFAAAWRRAHGIFREAGADKVEWVWAPNVVSGPDTPANDMHRYYPGGEFVDWIGVDGYNFGEHHDRWHVWQTFEEIYASVLADFEKRYAEKPLMISEFGCAPGESGQRRIWIRAAYEMLERHPRVRAVIWFNYDKSRENEPNWRLDEADGSLQAFNQTFAQPRRDATTQAGG